MATKRWNRPEVGSRELGRFGLAGFESGLSSVAIGIELEDGAVVHKAVDGGDGHGLIAEDLVPVTEGVIAGDDEGPLLIAMGDGR